MAGLPLALATEILKVSLRANFFDLPRRNLYLAYMAFIGLRVFFLVVLLCGFQLRAESFRVATYNVENYLDQQSGTRPAKSDAAKAKVRESILALKPDVLALQEIGGTNALFELQASLKAGGLDLPFWEHITAYDTNIQVAVLSRFPIVARHPHTNDAFLLAGRKFLVRRGFAEVVIQVNPAFSFTLMDAHLKSKVQDVPSADEADMRLEEARILRQKIDDCLTANPGVNLVVLGDLNDTHNSQAIRTIIGRGKKVLVDTRPGEHNGDSGSLTDRKLAARDVTWTEFYAKEDIYSRIDYILVSRAMERVLNTEETFVLAMPNWGLASDHRPLVATFIIPDGASGGALSGK